MLSSDGKACHFMNKKLPDFDSASLPAQVQALDIETTPNLKDSITNGSHFFLILRSKIKNGQKMPCSPIV